MGRIESYYINFIPELSPLSRFGLYLDLYEKILKKDSKWHYFTEGTYDELRFSSKFKRKVDKLLNEEVGIKVESYTKREEGWIDAQKIVEEYKDYFTVIFHWNTLLALELVDKSYSTVTNRHLQNIIDRIVHSFFNMIFQPFGDKEVEVMKNYLVDRAFYSGIVYQYNKMKELIDE
ncbi:MAG: hypothetical protein BV456_01645 [Thermoplasmata archaeon M8B2D]|nr:MAG: hypothetical protein BV456_01645 [Thermoplasmata archaeon M8B2D]